MTFAADAAPDGPQHAPEHIASPLLLENAAPVKRASWAAWYWAAGTLPALAYLLWSGAAADPRHGDFLAWTKTRWLLPTPGLGHFLIASALLFALLSLVAAQAQAIHGEKNAQRVAGTIGILLVAVVVRLIVLGEWLPLPLNSVALSAHVFTAPLLTRWPLLLADTLTILLLLIASARDRRSVFLVALYALHPLVLRNLADGAATLAVLPILILIAMFGERLRPWARIALMILAAAWGIARIAIASPLPAFNGLLVNSLAARGMESPEALRITLIAMEILLQSLIFLLAMRNRWSLARTWGHMFMAWAMVSPRVMPADVLTLLALLPLAWTRAGWVLSLTCLSVYALPFLAPFASPPALPRWLIFAAFLPVVIVELEELLLQALPRPQKIQPAT